MKYKTGIFLSLVVLSLSLLPSCTQPASTKSNAHDKESFDKIERIDDTNRNLIGKEGSGGDFLVVSADEIDQMLGSEGPTPEEIPENPIVSDAETGVVWGHAIQEIVTEEARTPELIAPNGMWVFFQKAMGKAGRVRPVISSLGPSKNIQQIMGGFNRLRLGILRMVSYMKRKRIRR